jgi:hypothetical protein
VDEVVNDGGLGLEIREHLILRGQEHHVHTTYKYIIVTESCNYLAERNSARHETLSCMF